MDLFGGKKTIAAGSNGRGSFRANEHLKTRRETHTQAGAANLEQARMTIAKDTQSAPSAKPQLRQTADQRWLADNILDAGPFTGANAFEGNWKVWRHCWTP
jgi:hypothetical protein